MGEILDDFTGTEILEDEMRGSMAECPVHCPHLIDWDVINEMLFRIDQQKDFQLVQTYMEYRYRLIISLLVATYSARYWRRQPPSKSGFLGVAGKRKKGKV
jgi:hypothetical protein